MESKEALVAILDFAASGEEPGAWKLLLCSVFGLLHAVPKAMNPRLSSITRGVDDLAGKYTCGCTCSSFPLCSGYAFKREIGLSVD